MKLLLSIAFWMKVEEGLAREKQQAEMQPFQKYCISEVKQRLKSHTGENS